jgi:hypothetical protein
MTTDERVLLQMIYDGILKVDEVGLIWKLKKRHKEWNGEYRPCTPHLIGSDARGYIRIVVRDGDKNLRAQAHRLVFLSLYGDIPDGIQINHKDGVRHNNHPDNLELMTPSQQMIHAVDVLGRRVGNHTHKARHWKIPSGQTESIRSSKEPSRALADKYGVTAQRIRQIRGGY